MKRKGWYGDRQRHSMASRGIQSTAEYLKNMRPNWQMHPYSDPIKMYKWLTEKRGWDMSDAFNYVDAMSNDKVSVAQKIVDEKYAYKTLMDAFKNVSSDETSTVYHTIYADSTDDWGYKYGFAGWLWKHPSTIKDPEIIKMQKNALLELSENSAHGKQSHVEIGEIPMTDLDDIYEVMQGENWSPLGEARKMISKKKTHTSMSIGDIITTPDGIYIVAGSGFLKYNELMRWHDITKLKANGVTNAVDLGRSVFGKLNDKMYDTMGWKK